MSVSHCPNHDSGEEPFAAPRFGAHPAALDRFFWKLCPDHLRTIAPKLIDADHP